MAQPVPEVTHLEAPSEARRLLASGQPDQLQHFEQSNLEVRQSKVGQADSVCSLLKSLVLFRGEHPCLLLYLLSRY